MYLKQGTALQWGKYKIVRYINSGGFGCTYEAVVVATNERVAIKEFFPKSFCNREEATNQISVGATTNQGVVAKLRKKFIEEAKAVRDMCHKHIVKVSDFFEENGTAYYVMEYIEGESLAGLVKLSGKMSEAVAIKYIRQIASALGYVHSLNRLHLDVKPGNVMINSMGDAVLIDFGASKHYDTETGENTSTLMGVNTPGYAPVEQSLQGFSHFNPATDIYSLGATLYKLLTGVTPPEANSLMSEVETLHPLSSDISLPTRQAVAAALKFKRRERPQSIAEFLRLLDGGSGVVNGFNDYDEDQTEIDQEPQEYVFVDDEEQEKSGGKGIWAVIALVCVAICVGIFFVLQDDGYSSNYGNDMEDSAKAFTDESPKVEENKSEVKVDGGAKVNAVQVTESKVETDIEQGWVYMSGSMGGKVKLSKFNININGHYVVGSVRYNPSFPDMEINGSISSNELSLEEWNGSEHCGSYRGIITRRGSHYKYSGTYTRARDGQRFSFTVSN